MTLLRDYIEEQSISTFLLDASGVLYTTLADKEGITASVQYLQTIGQVYLSTNNSYIYPDSISKRLKDDLSISLSEDAIISSGQGLAFDPSIKQRLQQGPVYVLGSDESIKYALDVPGIKICSSISEASVILITAFIKDKHTELFDDIKNELLKRPDIPIICCNPDQVIVAKDKQLYKVAGHYAEALAKQTNRAVNYFGKPYTNFSNLVEFRLKKDGIDPKHAMFFDDNVDNVYQLSQDLAVHACWIKDTGIHANKLAYAKEKLSLKSRNLSYMSAFNINESCLFF